MGIATSGAQVQVFARSAGLVAIQLTRHRRHFLRTAEEQCSAAFAEPCDKILKKF